MFKSFLFFVSLLGLILPRAAHAARGIVDLTAVSNGDALVNGGDKHVYLGTITVTSNNGQPDGSLTSLTLTAIDAPAISEATNLDSIEIFYDLNNTPVYGSGDTQYGATTVFSGDAAGTATFSPGGLVLGDNVTAYFHVYANVGTGIEHDGNLRISVALVANAQGVSGIANTVGTSFFNPSDVTPPDNDGVLTATRFGNIGGVALAWHPGSIDSADAESVGIWYDTTAAGGFPDSAYDPTAVLVGMYGMTDSTDTVYFSKALHNETLYFGMAVVDTIFNWSDTARIACDTAVVFNNDNTPPDNDGTLQARAIAGVGAIELTWQPAAIDSPDADSVGFWFKTTDFPDSAYDQSAGVVSAGRFPVAAGIETVTVDPAYYGEVYFSMVIRDVSGNWSDTTLATCDTAVAAKRTFPDNDLMLCTQPLSASSVKLAWYPGVVDSVDAESVLVWYRTDGWPAFPGDPGAVRAGGYSMTESTATITGLAMETKHYFRMTVKNTAGVMAPFTALSGDSVATLPKGATLQFAENYELKPTGIEPPAGWAVSNAGKCVVHAFDTTGLGRICSRAGRYERTGNPAPTLDYTFGDFSGDSVVVQWDFHKKTASIAGEMYWQSSAAAKVFDLQWGADGLLYLNDGGGYASTGFAYVGGQTYTFKITSNLAASDSFDLFIDDMTTRQGRYQRSGTNSVLGQVQFSGSVSNQRMFFDNFLVYSVDITPPDNDGTLTATSLNGYENKIQLAWQPGSIDSSDADSVGLWYDTTGASGFPDGYDDAGAVLLGMYALTDSVDTIQFSRALGNETLYFAVIPRDSVGNWADTALVACDTAVVRDMVAPDNDGYLVATALSDTAVRIVWYPGLIDSSDADSVGIWYKTTDYPDSADDLSAGVVKLGMYALSDSADTLGGLDTNTTYYFMMTVKDSAGNWADTARSAVDSARTLRRGEDMVFVDDFEHQPIGADPAGWVTTGDVTAIFDATANSGWGKTGAQVSRVAASTNILRTFNDIDTGMVVFEFDHQRGETGSIQAIQWMNSAGTGSNTRLAFWSDGNISNYSGGGWYSTGLPFTTALTHYKVEINLNDTSYALFIDDMSTPAAILPCEDPSVALGQVKVIANSNGANCFIDNVMVYRRDNVPPDNDVALAATAGPNKSVYLSWMPGNIDSVDADSMAIWYKTGDYPDSAYDASATLLAKYGDVTTAFDTLHTAKAGSTYYFMLFVRDSLGNWSDSSVSGGSFATAVDTMAPDNDVAMSVTAGANKSVLLSWTPGNIDSTDADSMAVWYKVGDYPDSAYDVTATLLAKYGDVTTAFDTLHDAMYDSTYYFMLFVRDTAGNWSDSLVNGGGFAMAVDTMAPDNDITLTASAFTCTSVAFSWNPALIDSADADSIGIWYKTGDYPDSAHDVTSQLATVLPVAASAGTLKTGLRPGSMYYFSFSVRDTAGNWADTVLAACDTARTYPGTLAVYGVSLDPGSLVPGTVNADMLLLKFYADKETVYVDTIIINVENTADTFDLDSVAIYSDNGGAADTMIPGAFAFAGSLGTEITVVLVPTDSLVVPRGETLRVHIVADIDAGANATHIVRLTVDAADSLRVRGKYSDSFEIITGSYPLQSGDVTLPVQLAAFTARQVDQTVVLAWRTESETDNLGYNVYRSLREEGPYRQINAAFIDGAINSETAHDYGYADSGVVSGGTYWYKIADMDITGLLTYHGPLRIKYQPVAGNVPDDGMVLSGNPLHPGSRLSFLTGRTGHTRLVLIDAEGHMVRVLYDSGSEPGQRVMINGTALLQAVDGAPGVHVLELRTDGKVERMRILHIGR